MAIEIKIFNALKAEWLGLPHLPQSDLALIFFDQLVSAYTSKQRFYHGPEHLLAILGLLRESGTSEAAAYWATFYHDYIYLAGKKDNESRSADLAKQQMQQLGVDAEVINQTVLLIEATAAHKPLDQDWMNRFLDADMSILGADSAVYQTYVENVRKEYQQIPRLLFNAGRKSFVKNCLSSPRIFITDWFFDRFETQARKNLAWELTTI
jgi:predicted metal-dependent HD superfamily phosphohydrolase